MGCTAEFGLKVRSIRLPTGAACDPVPGSADHQTCGRNLGKSTRVRQAIERTWLSVSCSIPSVVACREDWRGYAIWHLLGVLVCQVYYCPSFGWLNRLNILDSICGYREPGLGVAQGRRLDPVSVSRNPNLRGRGLESISRLRVIPRCQ